ncbi:conserved hypothetical protein [Histoplasma capsulatum H143]|uniref:Uncharacterized protein n=1 Tax=Ajellomyces capsulatus (strain H143) TaxID=544712 RepID=C6H9Y9_AJECH|nr:conserved hypothetical protein [Histoplasma capsulatum H143]
MAPLLNGTSTVNSQTRCWRALASNPSLKSSDAIGRRTKLKASRLWLGMKMKRKIKLGDLLGVSGVLDVVEHSWTEENRKNSTLAEKTWVFQYGNHQKARYMSFYVRVDIYAALHGSFDDVKKIPANGQDGFLAVVTLESSFGIYGKKA